MLTEKINPNSKAEIILKKIFENESRNISPETMISFKVFVKHYPAFKQVEKESFKDSLTKLCLQDRKEIESYFQRLIEARITYVLLGSWFGIGCLTQRLLTGNLEKGNSFSERIEKNSSFHSFQKRFWFFS